MSFINDDFILTNETAKKLYHDYAEKMPIIDYHCHINPKEIYENKKFKNITEIWLGGDHYKWRLIRSNGTPENEITGDADDYTKFLRFAEMLPRAIGNPMYHWNHLELKRYFDYDGILSAKTAEEVWNLCNEKLASDDMSACNIIKKSNVKMIGTTDDPIDTLEWHKKIKEEGVCAAQVLPSYRPDKAVNIDKDGFVDYIKALEKAADMEIKCVADVKAALIKRLDFFCEMGCKATDHGLDYIPFEIGSEKEIDAAFKAAMKGKAITTREADMYKTDIIVALGREYAKRGIVMQIHYSVQRNTNKAMFAKIGADTGFDTISNRPCSEALTGILNALAIDGLLPKTIIYSLNPHDNEMIDTVIGAFQGTEAAGKIQHGSAWWFSDTKSGMETQLKSLANLSLLGNFVGMLTDSRSFLSYTRHEYFRRILCNVLGTWVENGEYPADMETLGQIVEDICYNNAARYFGIE
ncbi:MAG: glucuronate isomerase [Clostridia bacterium]|nr:glucuronate isomerase [Clostridia bacterium]